MYRISFVVALVCALAAAPAIAEPDAKAVRAECVRAQADKRWVELEDCGLRLEKLGDAEGKKLQERAANESRAEVRLRELKDAIKEKNLKVARAKLALIPETSVYHAEAKAKVDAAAKAK
ncbi:MAG: hypothetical protein ABI867_43865 [Kofleriaceae bacterium]